MRSAIKVKQGLCTWWSKLLCNWLSLANFSSGTQVGPHRRRIRGGGGRLMGFNAPRRYFGVVNLKISIYGPAFLGALTPPPFRELLDPPLGSPSWKRYIFSIFKNWQANLGPSRSRPIPPPLYPPLLHALYQATPLTSIGVSTVAEIKTTI